MAVQTAMAALRGRVAPPEGIPRVRRCEVPIVFPVLAARVKALKSVISPGLLGWRNEFLKLVLRNPHHQESLRALVQVVAEARAPRAVRSHGLGQGHPNPEAGVDAGQP